MMGVTARLRDGLGREQAVEQGGAAQILARHGPVLRRAAQPVEIRPASRRIRLFEHLLVADRLLLHVVERSLAALAVIALQ
jgi:hypothetical protein